MEQKENESTLIPWRVKDYERGAEIAEDSLSEGVPIGLEDLEDIKQIADLRRDLKFDVTCERIPIIIENRKLLLRSNAVQFIFKGSTATLRNWLHLILFNDIVLLTRINTKPSPKFIIMDYCKTRELEVKELNGGDEDETEYKKQVLLTLHQNSKNQKIEMIVAFQNWNECKQWEDSLLTLKQQRTSLQEKEDRKQGEIPRRAAAARAEFLSKERVIRQNSNPEKPAEPVKTSKRKYRKKIPKVQKMEALPELGGQDEPTKVEIDSDSCLQVVPTFSECPPVQERSHFVVKVAPKLQTATKSNQVAKNSKRQEYEIKRYNTFDNSSSELEETGENQAPELHEKTVNSKKTFDKVDSKTFVKVDSKEPLGKVGSKDTIDQVDSKETFDKVDSKETFDKVEGKLEDADGETQFFADNNDIVAVSFKKFVLNWFNLFRLTTKEKKGKDYYRNVSLGSTAGLSKI